jgi:hypothetical protein
VVFNNVNTVTLGYNDLDFCDTSFITLYILCFQPVPYKARVLYLAEYGIHNSVFLG